MKTEQEIKDMILELEEEIENMEELNHYSNKPSEQERDFYFSGIKDNRAKIEGLKWIIE